MAGAERSSAGRGNRRGSMTIDRRQLLAGALGVAAMAAGRAAAQASRAKVIDVHTHMYSQGWVKAVERSGGPELSDRREQCIDLSRRSHRPHDAANARLGSAHQGHGRREGRCRADKPHRAERLLGHTCAERRGRTQHQRRLLSRTTQVRGPNPLVRFAAAPTRSRCARRAAPRERQRSDRCLHADEHPR